MWRISRQRRKRRTCYRNIGCDTWRNFKYFVGQKGFNGPGNAFNGGGSGCNDPSTCSGGGGASDVRKGGSGLANRVIVAGGGGGAEFSCGNQGGGAGGGLVGSNGLGGDCSVGDATGVHNLQVELAALELIVVGQTEEVKMEPSVKVVILV